MSELAERNERLLMDHIGGMNYHELGRREGISHVAARNAVVRAATEHLNHLEMQLLLCRKTGEAFGLAIPNQAQDDRALALDYLAWAVRRLRERGVDVEVTNHSTPSGLVIELRDRTKYKQEK